MKAPNSKSSSMTSFWVSNTIENRKRDTYRVRLQLENINFEYGKIFVWESSAPRLAGTVLPGTAHGRVPQPQLPTRHQPHKKTIVANHKFMCVHANGSHRTHVSALRTSIDDIFGLSQNKSTVFYFFRCFFFRNLILNHFYIYDWLETLHTYRNYSFYNINGTLTVHSFSMVILSNEIHYYLYFTCIEQLKELYEDMLVRFDDINVYRLNDCHLMYYSIKVLWYDREST